MQLLVRDNFFNRKELGDQLLLESITFKKAHRVKNFFLSFDFYRELLGFQQNNMEVQTCPHVTPAPNTCMASLIINIIQQKSYIFFEGVKVTQSDPTLCDPMNSPWNSQARILE